MVFRVVAAENDAARKLWTAEIVGAGGKVGLKFHEKWREADMEAGPLPALFLREASTALQKTRVPLGLFLGSDFPIAQSNKFSGAQAEHFANLRKTGNPEFFYAADIGRFTAIFRRSRDRTRLRDLPQRTPEQPEDRLEAQRHHGRDDVVVSEGAGHAGGAGADRWRAALELRRRL